MRAIRFSNHNPAYINGNLVMRNHMGQEFDFHLWWCFIMILHGLEIVRITARALTD